MVSSWYVAGEHQRVYARYKESMSRQILIIDDDPNLRHTLASILRIKGYETYAVGTGAAALEAVRTNPPAAALIDLRLEDMSGLDVLRQIKAFDDTIACILLTGYASQSSAIDAVNLGAYSYVQKPPNIDQLLLTIQRAIEKRTADLALRQSQALLHATGRMAKVGGWEIEVESHALVWTEEIYRIHGVTLDFEPSLDDSLSFYPKEARADVKHAFDRLLQTGEPFDLEVPFVPTTGDRLWVHLMGKADSEAGSGPASAPTKVSGTFQDITERKHAEDALRHSNRRLEETLAELREAQEQVIGQERMAAVGQMAAGLAHEYNNIMATIILYADMMLRSSSLSSVERDRISAIYNQGHRAADLTQQILDFSRKAILRKQEVAVTRLLQDLESRLRPMLSEQIDLVIDPGQPGWHLNADPDRVRQALTNIAINARDAMPEGGVLSIRVEALFIDSHTVPPLPDLKPGAWLVFHIQDTGTGIQPEVLPHIFEPFFTTRSPMCSGLGLSQVYGIARQHNGAVDVKTVVGEGTLFSLYMPALPLPGLDANQTSVANVTGEADQAHGEDDSQRALALVIEGHELVRDALVAALDSLNCAAADFETIDDAIKATRAGQAPSDSLPTLNPQHVRLILGSLDYSSGTSYGALTGRQPVWRQRDKLGDGSQPKTSGYADPSAGDNVKFAHDLRKHFPQACIVLIGDQVPNQEIQTMIRSGMIRWLEKPVDLVKLAEVLAETRL